MSPSRLLTCVTWVAAILLPACAYLERRTLEPTDRTAVVRAGPWGKVYRGGYVEIATIDGVEPGWRLRSELELNAGDRTAVFYVYLCADGPKHCNPVAETRIAFRAEAGHVYEARAREQINGSNRFWVWVEDQATGAVVGGTPPEKPTGTEAPPLEITAPA